MLARSPATETSAFAGWGLLSLGLVVSLVFFFGPLFIPIPELRVFGAASLQGAIDNANMWYRRETGRGVVASYGGSETLAEQIASGARADIFIAAHIDPMDYLAERNLIRPESRLNFLGNKLVLVASAGSEVTLAIGANFPLAQALGNGRLALADPASAPAGKYGKAALEMLGVWASVKDRLALAPDVRAASELVSRREAQLGIVYQTEAVADRGLDIVGTFPASSYPPITYVAAVTKASTNSNAEPYIKFLLSHAPVFDLMGFTVFQDVAAANGLAGHR